MKVQNAVEFERIRERIIEMLVNQVNIDNSEELDHELNLFSNDDSEGYGLDSVDALEIVVGLKKYFQIEIVNNEESSKLLRTINSLTEYVYENTSAKE